MSIISLQSDFSSSVNDQSVISFSTMTSEPLSELQLEPDKPANLPTELTHAIFLHALVPRTSSPAVNGAGGIGVRRNFASTLCLISCWTRELALPFLLRNIHIKSPANLFSLASVLSLSLPVTSEKRCNKDFTPLLTHNAWRHVSSVWIEGWAPGIGELFRVIGEASASLNSSSKGKGFMLRKVALSKEGFEEFLLHYRPSFATLEEGKGLHITILPSPTLTPSQPQYIDVFTPPTRISGITTSPIYALITHLILPLLPSANSSPSSILSSLPLTRLSNLTHLCVQTSLTSGMYDFLSPQILLHPSLRPPRSNSSSDSDQEGEESVGNTKQGGGMLVVAFSESGYPGGMLDCYKRNLREVRERLIRDGRLWFLEVGDPSLRDTEAEFDSIDGDGGDIWERARVWTEGLLADPRYA